MPITFDLFGTLLDATIPADPAASVAAELRSLGVEVPAAWSSTYATAHVDAPDGAEVPLPAHVEAALESRGVGVSTDVARRAVANAFDPAVETVPGAIEAIDAAATVGPVGLVSNCSVPELVPLAIDRADVQPSAFDAIVTSVACGWRKPHARPFEAVARRLGHPVESITHVGDDPRTDGGIEALGGRFVDVTRTPLEELPELIEAER
ncbi:MAG: HAD family hydrolase [Halobacteriota archaeon]